MANFPEVLDNFTPKVDSVDDVMAVDVNELQTAIESLQTKVGIDSSEDSDSLDYKIAQLQLGKQATLVSGTNIKTVNSESILGEGNIVTPNTTYTASDFDIKDLTDSTSLRSSWSGKQAALVSGTNIKTINSTSLLGEGNIEISGGSGAVDWIAKSEAYTAENGDGILANTSSGSWTLTLPATPSVGDVVGISDAAGTFSTNNLTVARNSSKIMGEEANLTVDVKDSSFLLVYTGATTGWKIDTYLPYGDTYSPPRVSSEESSATPTINTDNVDAHSITALATAITSMTTNLSGSPTNFQKLIIRIKDNGTARAIAWGASFEAKGVALPTTTVISKVLTVGFIYDTATSKWGCVAVSQEE